MPQFESAFNPLNPQFITDFSDPAAFLSSLGPKAQAPPSSGGSSGKPPTSIPPIGNQPMSDRDQFKAGLQPYIQARLGMATTPEAVNRVQEWAANRLAGYDARQSLNERAARQRASLIEKAKKKKAQQEANRKYRTDLAAELEASRQFGEQNPAQPTGPSPETVVDQMNAEYSRRQGVSLQNKRDSEERARQLKAKRLADSMAETDAMRQTLFGYDKAEAARLRGAGERTAAAEAASAAAAADAAAKAQVESTLLPRDVNSLIAKTPTGQLAALATPMGGNVTAPLNPQPYPAQPVTAPLNLVATNQAAERELFEKQMADAEQEKKIRAIVEGTMARYNAGRGSFSNAPAFSQRDPAAEAMAANAPRLSASQIPAGVPTMGGADAEQVAFNQKVQELMARGISNQEAISIARGENPGVYERVRQGVTQDPNLAPIDPAGLNVMSALDVLAGEGTVALGRKGLQAAGLVAPRAVRPATSAPVETPLAPEVRSAPAQPNRFTPTTPEETALQADLQGIRPFDAGSPAARRAQMAEADRLRNRIREMGADPEVVTGPTNVAGDAFSQAVDARRVPPALDMPPPARRRPDRLSPESIEAAQKEGMLFDIGAPAAPAPKAAAATATETATATGSAPKGQMTFDQLYEAPKPTAPGAPKAGTKAARFELLSPEEKATELMKTYDRTWQSVSSGRITNEQFNEMVVNTLKGKHGELFRKALDAKYPGAVDQVLGRRP